MERTRFDAITSSYPKLRVAIVGDFCLDRYLEIDPAKGEISIETRLPVYNVVNVRAQPGAAGTILNNLVALGAGQIFPVGFCGLDGEGHELRDALQRRAGVNLDHFLRTPDRRTFTYCKPLVIESGKPPQELNRLDTKNWTPTPREIERQLVRALEEVSGRLDAIVVMDQVGMPETGVITRGMLAALGRLALNKPNLLILADSRRSLREFPPVTFKMNAAELAALTGSALEIDHIRKSALECSRRLNRTVFVTLSERGILGAEPIGNCLHIPAWPVRGEIDVVGAGDAVTANLTVALAAGANLEEALHMANAAASVVIHQLGTTGTASLPQIWATLSRRVK